MKCPECGTKLRGRKARYGMVYVCEPCGIMIIKVPEHYRRIVKREASS
jgi:DNA-directed RNA polymerase subunit M/transcription elongation factor TFIIS